jgi:ATP-dependent Lon protease
MVRYAQGWLVGVTESTAGVLPFEVSVRSGGAGVTFSGPVSADVESHFHLSVLAATLALQRHCHPIDDYAAHLNFPLHHVAARGPSCRLAFANTLISALAPGAGYRPEYTALLGDITLDGQILPVGHAARKAVAARESGLPNLVVPAGTEPPVPNAVMIDSLAQIPGVRT